MALVYVIANSLANQMVRDTKQFQTMFIKHSLDTLIILGICPPNIQMGRQTQFYTIKTK